jgi:hypothetical protein
LRPLLKFPTYIKFPSLPSMPHAPPISSIL